MIETLKQTNVFKSLNLGKIHSHAVLFYSQDSVLNDEIAKMFARKNVCESETSCGVCHGCQQFVSNSHPDVFVLDQDSIKVEDIAKLNTAFSTKPIESNKKVFLILNADKMNEIAQNKLLKSLEEPNDSTMFILTTSKPSKILPTIMSRLLKIYVPKINFIDKETISTELENQGIQIKNYMEKDFSLKEIFDVTADSNYLDTLNQIKTLFSNLTNSASIPQVVTSLKINDKALFFKIMQEVMLSALDKNQNKFPQDVIDIVRLRFTDDVIRKCLPKIEDAYFKLNSNVNFNYIIDNLLFLMLKEKYLCKQ